MPDATKSRTKSRAVSKPAPRRAAEQRPRLEFEPLRARAKGESMKGKPAKKGDGAAEKGRARKDAKRAGKERTAAKASKSKAPKAKKRDEPKAKKRTEPKASKSTEPRASKSAEPKAKKRSAPEAKPTEPKARKRAAAKAPRATAATADRYELYQRAVNSPETDVDFLLKTYAHHHPGKRPLHLREDFCGTANLSAEWLARDPAATAEGFDLDPEPIEWGKERNFGRVADGLARMTFHLSDVRDRAERRPDITTAPNFSYWCFHTRRELLEYFRAAHADLAPDGVFVIDVYGGPDAIVEMEEVRDIGGGLRYVWDQRLYWPGTGEYRTAIHFRFRDGTELTNAFEYDWRFWNVTELKDMLEEVGFRSVGTWFEGTDPDDEESGDGNFELDARGENCQAWIGYIVAAK